MQTWQHRSEFILQTSGAAILLRKMDFCRFSVCTSAHTLNVWLPVRIKGVITASPSHWIMVVKYSGGGRI
jgi:hypothetical protein